MNFRDKKITMTIDTLEILAQLDASDLGLIIDGLEEFYDGTNDPGDDLYGDAKLYAAFQFVLQNVKVEEERNDNGKR